MDQGLFGKYHTLLNEKKKDKQKVLEHIYQKTGVKLSEQELEIKGTRVSFHVSSVVRMKLEQNRIHDILATLHYTGVYY